MPASSPSQFSLRGLLALTVIVALALLPLAKPWVGWLLALPTFAGLVAVFVVSRLVTSPERAQVFWICFLVGAYAYLAAVFFIGEDRNPWMSQSGFWDEHLNRPLWLAMHGTEAFRTNNQGITSGDFVSFRIYVHVVAALIVSSVAACIAQLAAVRRTRILQKSSLATINSLTTIGSHP